MAMDMETLKNEFFATAKAIKAKFQRIACQDDESEAKRMKTINMIDWMVADLQQNPELSHAYVKDARNRLTDYLYFEYKNW